jgi:3-carboxy-cis,cis-muconate cycloisomerase
MPHKQNPSGCVRTLAAAARLPGLAATALAGLVQEHERAVGAWQAEWPVVAEALQATGATAEALLGVIAGLGVDPARMRANLEATGGAVLAERVLLLATPALGRSRAQALVKDAVAAAKANGEPLAAAVRNIPELAGAVSDTDLRALDDPAGYLGSAETLRRRLLAGDHEPGGDER